jgi:DNA-directed RNA polymerase subunit beta
MTWLMQNRQGKSGRRAGAKITARQARKLGESGLKEILIQDEELIGSLPRVDIARCRKPAKLFSKPATKSKHDRSIKSKASASRGAGPRDRPHQYRPYVRNTMLRTSANREDALIDIYRVMRPGEPPTLESADALFNSAVLRFRALRSVACWPRQNERPPGPENRRPGTRVLRRHPRDPENTFMT